MGTWEWEFCMFSWPDFFWSALFFRFLFVAASRATTVYDTESFISADGWTWNWSRLESWGKKYSFLFELRYQKYGVPSESCSPPERSRSKQEDAALLEVFRASTVRWVVAFHRDFHMPIFINQTIYNLSFSGVTCLLYLVLCIYFFPEFSLRFHHS